MDQGALGRSFAGFPQGTRDGLLDAPTAVAEGGHPSIAKPLTSFGCGVIELVLGRRGDAVRLAEWCCG